LNISTPHCSLLCPVLSQLNPRYIYRNLLPLILLSCLSQPLPDPRRSFAFPPRRSQFNYFSTTVQMLQLLLVQFYPHSCAAVLLEKPIKKFPAFYRNRDSITVFTGPVTGPVLRHVNPLRSRNACSICLHRQTLQEERYKPRLCTKYEGWNFNSGNYLFTTDTK